MKLQVLFLAFALFISSIAFGQMKYSDRRLMADTDTRTLQARESFNSAMKNRFESYRRKYRLENMNLYLHPRLVSQYGRGKASAMRVIPMEMKHAMKLISEAKYHPVSLVDCFMRLKAFRNNSYEEITKAVEFLGQTQTLRMEYWGYMVQTEQPPEFDIGNRTLTQKAHWHEADSYYELYPEKIMRIKILKAVIAEMNRPWYVFW